MTSNSGFRTRANSLESLSTLVENGREHQAKRTVKTIRIGTGGRRYRLGTGGRCLLSAKVSPSAARSTGNMRGGPSAVQKSSAIAGTASGLRVRRRHEGPAGRGSEGVFSSETTRAVLTAPLQVSGIRRDPQVSDGACHSRPKHQGKWADEFRCSAVKLDGVVYPPLRNRVRETSRAPRNRNCCSSCRCR